MKIAVVGDFGIDYYENLNLYKPGGIAFNVVYNLKTLGVKSISLVSILGRDKYLEKLLKVAKKAKIDTSHVQLSSGESPLQKIFLEKGERKFTGYVAGVLKKWELNKNDLDFIKKHNLVFVPLTDGMEQIFKEVKVLKGIMKATDFSQDYEFADFDKKDNVITKNVPYFDIIFVGGKLKHKKLVKSLSQKYPNKVFVLTLGSKGSIAFSKDKEYFELAKKVKVVDTTGCGDAFQAGFLATYLMTNNVQKSLKSATMQASKIIGLIGSTNLGLWILKSQNA